jgi:hypothetical protein
MIINSQICFFFQTWRHDTTQFGYRMLLKMGWSEGKGLGVNEDGITECLQVRKRKVEFAGKQLKRM